MKTTGFSVRAAVALAFLFAAGSAGAQPLQDFTKIVDFNATLRTLSEEASQHRPLSAAGKLVVLTGVAATIQSLSNDPKQFFALIELVDGRWHGLESVSLYRCYVLAQGPRFASQVLLQPTSSAPANAIRANSQLLVVGQVKGVVNAPDGGVVPVVEAYLLRSLD